MLHTTSTGGHFTGAEAQIGENAVIGVVADDPAEAGRMRVVLVKRSFLGIECGLDHARADARRDGPDDRAGPSRAGRRGSIRSIERIRRP